MVVVFCFYHSVHFWGILLLFFGGGGGGRRDVLGRGASLGPPDPCSRTPHDWNLLENYTAPFRSLSVYLNIINLRLCLCFRPQLNLTKGRNVIFFEAAYFYDDTAGGPGNDEEGEFSDDGNDNPIKEDESMTDEYTSSSDRSVQISEIKITGELLFIRPFLSSAITLVVEFVGFE